jgi:NAD(P)-dependent dehydrogenase (short-subunit alcohol dehydrogenase family)
MTANVAIVTGASSGIGAATARHLQTMGYTVYAAARRLEQMAPLAETGIRPIRVDVTDDACLTAFVAQVIAETGRIDVLVNNAGYGSLGAVEDVPMAEARRQFDVNVFGLTRLIQLVVPHMRAQRSGHIINISSVGGKVYESLGGWYHATKFAVEGLSDCLRMELAPFGIHVVIIEPGSIRTEWSGIAADNLAATSGHGPYAGQATAIAEVLAATDSNPRLSSPPEIIADTVARAVRARRPRTRYAVGAGAKPIILARRILTDRAFDALMRRAFRLDNRSTDNSQPLRA